MTISNGITYASSQSVYESLKKYASIILDKIVQACKWVWEHIKQIYRACFFRSEKSFTMQPPDPQVEDFIALGSKNYLEIIEESPRAILTSGLDGGVNSCFLNAVIQATIGEPISFQALFNHPKQHTEIQDCAFRFIRGENNADITKLIRNLKDKNNNYVFPMFANAGQHTAAEAYQELLQNIGNEEGHPLVYEIQGSQKFNVEVEEECQILNQNVVDRTYTDQLKDEFVHLLPLHLPDGQEDGNLRVENLLQNYFINNHTSDSDSRRVPFRCLVGGAEVDVELPVTPAERNIQLSRCPECLVLETPRIITEKYKKDDGTAGAHFKESNITFMWDKEDLSVYLDPKHTRSEKGGRYEVRSFVIHNGRVNEEEGSRSGHFHTYRKVDNAWYYFSDTTRKKVTGNEELENQFDEDICKKVHLIFAVRTNVDNEVLQQKLSDRVSPS